MAPRSLLAAVAVLGAAGIAAAGETCGSWANTDAGEIQKKMCATNLVLLKRVWNENRVIDNYDAIQKPLQCCMPGCEKQRTDKKGCEDCMEDGDKLGCEENAAWARTPAVTVLTLAMVRLLH